MRSLRRFLPDPHDATIVAGLGMLFGGCWWVYPPSALIVVGSIVTAVAIIGAR